MLFLDGKRRDLHVEGWDVRFRDIEGEKKLELTYKKRYPVQGDDIDAALDAAARQGFDAGESDYEAEVEWGAETPNLRLRAPVLYPTGNAGHYVALDRPTGETVSSPTVTPQRQRLAAQAAPDPDRVCTTLASLIDTDCLREAYHQTSMLSAAGIDGGTAQQYAACLDENWRDRHERRRSGCSEAAPIERVWLAKDDGGQRPMGKPICEEKMVQRAVAMVPEAIDAQDFYDGSYGLQPGRSPHEALQAW
jgi:hypothetical protein